MAESDSEVVLSTGAVDEGDCDCDVEASCLLASLVSSALVVMVAKAVAEFLMVLVSPSTDTESIMRDWQKGERPTVETTEAKMDEQSEKKTN
jgi:hypothetical protein